MSENDRKMFALQKAREYEAQHGTQGEKGGYPFKSLTPEQLDYTKREAIKEAQAGERLRLQREKVMGGGWSNNPYEDLFGGHLGQAKNQPVNVTSYMKEFGSQPEAGTDPSAEKPIPVSEMPVTQHNIKDAIAQFAGLTYHKAKKGEEWDGWHGNIVNGDKIVSAHNLMPYSGNANDYGAIVEDIEGVKVIPSPDLKGKKPYAIVRLKFKNQSDMDAFGAINHHYLFPSSEKAASQGDVDFKNHTLKALLPIQTPQENQLGVRQLASTLRKSDQLKNAVSDDSFYGSAQIANEDAE